MALPRCVLKALNRKQISYEIFEACIKNKITALHQQNSTEQLAIMILLETTDTKLQAIISSTSLLNLDALNERTGSNVQAVSESTLEQLLAIHGLETLPAIPEITGYETLVDQALLEASTVYFESGQQDTLIALNNADFRLLCEQSQSMSLGISLYNLLPLSSDKNNDPADIYTAIRNYTSLQIKKRLSDTLEIPPLSDAAKKILALSSDPDPAIEDLVKVIETDPGLAAQVVSWAASPYYSAPGKVKSIQDAIVRVLGFELVLNLALGLAMGQSLKVPQNGYCSGTLFLRQSVYCALIMEKLNATVPANTRGQPGLAYLAGLLNNFGYLVLAHVFPAHFVTLCLYKQANKHVNPVYIEQHLLGITGEQISSQLAEAWNLPSPIINSLRFQQDPSYNGPDALYANLCFISKRLLTAMGISNQPSETIPSTLYHQLKLNPGDVEKIVQALTESQGEIELMLSNLTTRAS